MTGQTLLKITSRGISTPLTVPVGSRNLAAILAGAGYRLNTRCHHRGLCSGCRVNIEGEGEVLSCRRQLLNGESLGIDIPEQSLVSLAPSIVSNFLMGISAGKDPLFGNQPPLSIAMDIGTTTVAALLVESASGKVLAECSAMNGQVVYGDNVLTRIQACRDSAGALDILFHALWNDTVSPLLKRLLSDAGVEASSVAGVCLAGNTTMLHLASRTDPSPLGVAPFAPAFLDVRRFHGGLFGLPGNWQVLFLPGLSAYVGSDIVAGALCTGLIYADSPSLLVDVGTNGEMILVTPQGRWATATAAGPAFEGSGLSCGMRAAAGAVGHIKIDPVQLSTRLDVIGDGAILGIAGSAYIDFLAEAVRHRIVTPAGRFQPGVIARHPARFRREESGLSFLLGADLWISEVDIALLLQAKAAIAAGIETLMAVAGVSPQKIGRVFLSGGFGFHIDISNAIRCGLLPGFEGSQIQPSGNTSLGGAYLAAVDRSLLTEMAGIEASVVELNLDPGFEDRYIDHLTLSEDNL